LVFRYKDFADAVVLCAKLGNYTKDDELIVVKKAQTIVDCFIDSQIAPKVQVIISLRILVLIGWFSRNSQKLLNPIC